MRKFACEEAPILKARTVARTRAAYRFEDDDSGPGGPGTAIRLRVGKTWDHVDRYVLEMLDKDDERVFLAEGLTEDEINDLFDVILDEVEIAVDELIA
jgi:hypothetical protein